MAPDPIGPNAPQTHQNAPGQAFGVWGYPYTPQIKKTLELRVNFFLDEGEVSQLLNAIPDREWAALRQVVLEQMENATQYVSNVDVCREHGSLAHYSGQVLALRELLDRLKDLRKRGTNV